MPTQRITPEMVLDAALELARTGGMEQVLVKNLAEKLNCSVQPIYSYFQNMDALRQAVTQRVCLAVRDYAAARTDPANPFASVGRAYVQLARDEPHLFRIFTLHRREGIASLDDLYRSEASAGTADYLASALQISLQQAKQLHLHMLIYTIGLGAIFSVTAPGISAEEIFSQQELAYRAFLKSVGGNVG